ncbi:hypothetical protein C3486_17250 [Streptomyces sp. Ru73]|uniref:hypothetical protein n=1 Tax=Streptomyces sp. Ru73 TaxID=2080748 RepID=UPI000CDD1616|nr:hypothetical protein [Streptomyces sp. Ru73]POX39636.1 hypothetical protein C3486_17250 [Streptomyces sp. Ru73]
MVRESNIRMIALASTIALALTLPLAAAIAGPSGPGDPATAAKPSVSPLPHGGTVAQGTAGGGDDRPQGTPRGSAQEPPHPARPGDLLAGLGLGKGAGRANGGTTHCGPHVTSSRGIEAQTCVLTTDGDTTERGTQRDTEDGDGSPEAGSGSPDVARTRTKAVVYYRNSSGEPLRAVLTLMRPDGRTVQTHCELPAANEPGSCGTPSGATVRGSATYSAVAEIADVRSDRLLLRAGSNSAPSAPR